MPLTRKLAIKIALAYGFVSKYQRGSHEYFVYNEHKATIPYKKEFPIGTGKAILQQIAAAHGKSWKDLVNEYNIKL